MGDSVQKFSIYIQYNKTLLHDYTCTLHIPNNLIYFKCSESLKLMLKKPNKDKIQLDRIGMENTKNLFLWIFYYCRFLQFLFHKKPKFYVSVATALIDF